MLCPSQETSINAYGEIILKCSATVLETRGKKRDKESEGIVVILVG